MNNVGKSKNNLDMNEIHKLINSLIKEDKLKFRFYNSLDKLELLQLCHNKVDNTIEFEFRNKFKAIFYGNFLSTFLRYKLILLVSLNN